MSTKLTTQILEENGYSFFVNSMKTLDRSSKISSSDAYKGTWQKCFRDDDGKRYFINISMWDFRGLHAFANDKEPSFSADTQFNDKNGETFNLELFSNTEHTLQTIERFFEKAWIRMGCEYYEKYE